MTYLELVNAVLVRLREDTIDVTQLDSDPYYRVIGSHVNDAKDRVEDAWQWGALRGTDYVPLTFGSGVQFELPNSADNHYIIKRTAAFQWDGDPQTPQFAMGAKHPMRWVSVQDIRARYLQPENVQPNTPFEFAVTGTADSGNILITVYPIPDDNDWWMEIDRVNHQDQLVNYDDVLKVPSLPVYTLATALASRERGEVGGDPYFRTVPYC